MTSFKKTLGRTAALGLLLVLIPATGAETAQGIVVKHAQGQTTLPATPKKVAVFDLASLDILNALGVDAVVAVAKPKDKPANFPPHLARYGDARYAAAGSLFEPDQAALKALQPDLIIIGSRSRRAYDALSTIAPTIDLSPVQADLAATAIANTRTLGRLFGEEQRADATVAAFEQALAALHAQAKSQGTGLLLFAAGENISAQAPGSRFGHAYDSIGIRPVLAPTNAVAGEQRPKPGTPAAEAARKRQQDALATALATEPDWIFTIDRSAAVGTAPSDLPERLAADQKIAASKAWKAGRVVHLDPKTWYLVGAGIEALTNSAEDVRSAFTKTASVQ